MNSQRFSFYCHKLLALFMISSTRTVVLLIAWFTLIVNSHFICCIFVCPILFQVNKRGHMFAEYKTLDQKSDDPSRLANRGGALLKEEKERKKLEKTIPKIEAELKSLCEVFEQSADDGNGMTKFLVYARTINEMIEQDWGEFHEEKRLRKEAKVF